MTSEKSSETMETFNNLLVKCTIYIILKYFDYIWNLFWNTRVEGAS